MVSTMQAGHLTPVTVHTMENMLKSNIAHAKNLKAGQFHSQALERVGDMLNRAEVVLHKLFASKSAPLPKPGPKPNLDEIKFNEENEETFQVAPTLLEQSEQEYLVNLNYILRGLDCSNNLLDPAYEPLFEDSTGLLFEDMDKVESRSFLSRKQFNSRFTMARLQEFDEDNKIPFCDGSFAFLLPEFQKLEGEKDQTDISVFVNVYYTRVTIDLSRMTLSKDFLSAIDAALEHGEVSEQKYDALVAVFDRFGHIFCTRLYLGGKIYLHMSDIEVKKGEEEKAKKEVAAWSASNELSAQTNQLYGGDTTLYEIPAKWVKSTQSFDTWRVIEYVDLVPTYTLLDLDRRQKVDKIYKTFHKYV